MHTCYLLPFLSNPRPCLTPNPPTGAYCVPPRWELDKDSGGGGGEGHRTARKGNCRPSRPTQAHHHTSTGSQSHPDRASPLLVDGHAEPRPSLDLVWLPNELVATTLDPGARGPSGAPSPRATVGDSHSGGQPTPPPLPGIGPLAHRLPPPTICATHCVNRV